MTLHAPRPSSARLHTAALLLVLLALPAAAVPLRFAEGNTQRPLRMSTEDGQVLAEGTYTQWREGERLHLLFEFDFKDGRQVQETAVFRLQPELIQERWSWQEKRGEQVLRRFRTDFTTGRATGLDAREGGKGKRWSETLKVEPGRTFAGVGMALAVKHLMPTLKGGEKVELSALAPTPKPRRVTLGISHAGTASVQHGGRQVQADKVLLHPQIGLASVVVKTRDTELYFVDGRTPQLVAGVGTLLLPEDPVVRTELLPRTAPSAARRGPPRR